MEVTGKKPDLSEEEITCLPCSLEGSTEPAYGYCQDCEEHLCETCFKHHKRSRPSRNHVLLDKDVMPLQQTFTSVKSDDETDVCPKHTDKRLEFYCHTHDKAACYVCITLRHKTCEVDYIPDISGNIMESDELRNLTDQLKTLKEKCETSILQTRSAEDNIELDQAKILKEMKRLRKELNQCLDKMEAELEGKLELLTSTLRTKLNTQHDEYEDIDEEVGDLESKLNSLTENGQKSRLFLEMKIAKKSLAILEDREVKTRKHKTHCDIEFVRNNQLVEILKAEIFGLIVSNDMSAGSEDGETNEGDQCLSSHHSLPPAEDRIVNLVFSGRLDVMSPSDDVDCNILGMTFLPPRNIVLADYDNKCVKVLDKESKKLLAEVHLSSGPRDVICLSENKLAIAQPDKKCIQILSLTETTNYHISVERSFDIKKKCFCLAYSKDRHIVGCDYDPGKVIILDHDGNVLKEFEPSDPFVGPEKIVVSKDMGNLYISDSYLKHKIVRIDWVGNVLDTFEGDFEPAGIQELEDGTFLVCCTNTNSIVRLSKNLRKCRMVGLDSTNLKCPTALAYCETDKKLFVSCASDEGNSINTVKVFNLNWA